ncbi:MAG: PilZ domain-containing protein [Croceibacterium sp.]
MHEALLETPSDVSERRGADRSRRSGEAHLQTPSGDWRGMLWDLSETGARIQVAHPPMTGASALLRWQDNETWCRVVWTTHEMCGVAFDHPITHADIRAAISERTGPKPTLGNIPLGQKRSRPA